MGASNTIAAWSLLLLMGAGACTAILGDDFQIVAETSSGTGGGGGSTTQGGGGAGGTTSTGGGGSAPVALHHAWSRRFGDGAGQELLALATDANDQIVIAGTFEGTLEFGGDELVAFGTDAFVAKLTADGEPLWARQYGAAGATVQPQAVAVDSVGDIVVTGQYEGSLDFGGAFTMSQGVDAFLLKITANGAFVDSLTFGDADALDAPQSGRDVAIGPEDRIVLVGNYSNTVNVWTTTLTSSANMAFFVALFDSALGFQGSASFGNLARNQVSAVAADDGGIYLAGDFEFQLSFETTLHTTGDQDLFIAELGYDLVPSTSRALGSSEWEHVTAAALSPNGGAMGLVGASGGSIDFGGGALPNGGDLDALIAMFDSSQSHLWSHGAGSAGDQLATSLAMGPTGRVFAAGRFQGELDWGGGPLVADANLDSLFLTAWTSDGAYQDDLAFQAAVSQTVLPQVAATSDGGVVMAGGIEGSVDFGGGALPSAGGTDVFVAKFE